MKSISLLFTLIFLISAPAFAWEKIVDCESGNLVIDIGPNDESGRPTYQLVVRGPVLEYFVKMDGIKKDMVRNNEFVAPLNIYDGAFFASQALNHSEPITYLRQWVYVSRHQTNAYLKSSVEGHIGGGGYEKVNWQFYNCWIK